MREWLSRLLGRIRAGIDWIQKIEFTGRVIVPVLQLGVLIAGRDTLLWLAGGVQFLQDYRGVLYLLLLAATIVHLVWAVSTSPRAASARTVQADRRDLLTHRNVTWQRVLGSMLEGSTVGPLCPRDLTMLRLRWLNADGSSRPMPTLDILEIPVGPGFAELHCSKCLGVYRFGDEVMSTEDVRSEASDQLDAQARRPR